MAVSVRYFIKGIELRPTTDETSLHEGIMLVNGSENKLKIYLGGSLRKVVTEDQSQTLTNKTLTSPVINSPTGITKSDVGLSNVDNTSDATKNAAAVALTNHTIDASLNTISNITNTEIAAAAAIARTKLASGTNNALQANNGSGVLSDIADVTVGTNNLTLANTKHLEIQAATDASTTGTAASLSAFTAGAVRLTNGSLVSLANIPAGANGQDLVIYNRTGVDISIEDDSAALGTAANRILTGTGAVITFAANAALVFRYDITSSRWQIVGGSGGGTAFKDSTFDIHDVSDVTKKILFDAAGTTGTSTTLQSSQTSNKILTLPDATDTLLGRATTDTLTNKSINGSTNTITNVSLTSGVTGTLPTANGGTGLNAVGTETKVLKIVSGVPAWAEEDRSNLLLNPNFEGGNSAGVATSWTNSSTGSTPTITTTSGEFSEGSQAQKIALSAGVLNFFQSQNTPSGIVKQGKVGVTYRAGTAIAGFQICSLVDGSEQVCIPTSNLIVDDAYHTIEIPVIFGSTSAGIKLKSTSSTGNVFIDNAYVRTGNPVTNLQLDNTYSFRSSSAGVVTLENKDFINGNASISATSVYTYTFNSGFFTAAPNCTCTVDRTGIGSNAICGVDSSSATQVVVETKIPGTGAFAAGHQVVCQKSGTDYVNASSQIYSQASANYDWTDYTPTFSNFGTITPSTNACKHRRVGGDLEIQCKGVLGTTVAALASMTLPNSLTIDSARLTASNTTANPGQQVGIFIHNGASSGSYSSVVTATGTSTSLLYFTNSLGASSYLTPANGNTKTSSVDFTLQAKIPIAGWTNSAYIVGSIYALNDVATVSYTVASGTSGGSATAAAWNDRPLNTIDSDFNSILTSLSSNTITLPAGTYQVLANAMTNNTNIARLRLRNTTDSTTICQGVNSSDEVVNASTPTLQCQFTITAPKAIKLQQWVTTNYGATALGRPASSGDSEVYAQVTVRRLK